MTMRLPCRNQLLNHPGVEVGGTGPRANMRVDDYDPSPIRTGMQGMQWRNGCWLPAEMWEIWGWIKMIKSYCPPSQPSIHSIC